MSVAMPVVILSVTAAPLTVTKRAPLSYDVWKASLVFDLFAVAVSVLCVGF